MCAAKADALEQTVRAALADLDALGAHASLLGPEAVANAESIRSDVTRRLGRQHLTLVVAGERGSGKRTFINALLGEPLLPPCDRAPDAIVLFRHGSSENYRARLTDGAVEEFAARCPDGSSEILEEIRNGEKQIEALTRERKRAMQALKAATQATDAATTTLTSVFQSFEDARDDAERVARELASSEAEEARLEQHVSEHARALPGVLIERPPFWAFWLWGLRFLLALLWADAVRSYRQTLDELNRARDRATSLRRATSDAANACLKAEGRLEAAASPMEQNQATFARERARLFEVDQRLAGVSRQLGQRQAELDQIRQQRRQQFREAVAEMYEAGQRGSDLLVLEIEHPAPLLPPDVTLLHVPGLTADDPAVRRDALDVVRDRADSCLLLSELERGFSRATQRQLRCLRDAVPHIALVHTKLDESTHRARRQSKADPAAEVERARRIGTRRFARERGRDPSAVLAIAVAARPALNADDEASPRDAFATDIGRCFQSLRDERALILGVRAANDVRRCIRQISESQARAERSHGARVADLERRKRPDPSDFRTEQIDATEPFLAAAATAITRAAVADLRARLSALQDRCREHIATCSSSSELRERLDDLDLRLADALQAIPAESTRHTEERMDAALRELERTSFDALRRRYAIAPPVTRWTQPTIYLEIPFPPAKETLGLAIAAAGVLRSFTFARICLLAGGVVAGAVLGTVIAPITGTLVGAAAGAMLFFAKTLARLKQVCLRVLDEQVAAEESKLEAQLSQARDAIYRTMRAAFERTLSRAVIQYDQWITAPLQAEQVTLVRERHRLAELVTLGERLQDRDRSLARVTNDAMSASLGLHEPAAPPVPRDGRPTQQASHPDL